MEFPPCARASYTRETLQDLVDRTRDVIASNFNPDYPSEKPID
jgi:hypothetical protein